MKSLAVTLVLLLALMIFSTPVAAESEGGSENSYIVSEVSSETDVTTSAEQGMENDPNLGVAEPEISPEEPSGEAGSEKLELPELPSDLNSEVSEPEEPRGEAGSESPLELPNIGP